LHKLKVFYAFSFGVIGCLHDPANAQHQHVYFEYICWKFPGHLLDRVNTPLVKNSDTEQIDGQMDRRARSVLRSITTFAQ